MLLRPADDGGFFEYLPSLRSANDGCYDNVKKVLDSDRSGVKRLELNAGDLQFFLGRFSLHQVTENIGQSDRLVTDAIVRSCEVFSLTKGASSNIALLLPLIGHRMRFMGFGNIIETFIA
jgi:hypothetical protein